MTAYQFLGVLVILIIFIISLWRQSGVLFLITFLSVMLLGLLGRLETWLLIVMFAIGVLSLVVGIVKIAKGEF